MSKNNTENLKNALCYIPLVAIFFYFTEKNTNEEYKKHIEYGILLFILYIVITIILNLLWMPWLTGLVVLGYIGVSIFLGFKAYNGKKNDIKILNNILNKFKNTK